MPAGAGVPGKGWYWAAAGLALAATAAAVAIIVWLVLALDEDAQFLAPGRHVLELSRPGEHVVWNDHRTVFQGRSYDESATLPSGARITVREAGGGELAVTSSRGASTRTNTTERVSVAKFTVVRPGPHEIVVEGRFEPRVFSVGRDLLLRWIGVIFGTVALVLTGYTAALGIAAWAYLKRDNAGEPAPSGPGSTALADRSLKVLAAIVYALQLASFFVGITFIAGVIVNYARRADARGTWLESHFDWQIRTFWWGMLWIVAGFATLVVLIGFAILAAASLWVLYRAIRGWIALEEGKPIGA